MNFICKIITKFECQQCTYEVVLKRKVGYKKNILGGLQRMVSMFKTTLSVWGQLFIWISESFGTIVY